MHGSVENCGRSRLASIPAIAYTKPMTIQIYGTRKCPNTRKAERFFKDRDISYQFRDIQEKPPSKGELQAMAQAIGYESMIDTAGKEYQRGGWAYREFEPEESLLEVPTLLKTPIIRSGSRVLCGYDDKALKALAQEG